MAIAVAATTAALAAVFGAVLADIIPGNSEGDETATTLAPRDEETAPLSVAVDRDEDYCTTNWFMPRPPDEIAFDANATPQRPYDDPDAYDWSSFSIAEGGFMASPANIVATVQGLTETTVILTGIDVTVHKRRPPPIGTLLDQHCGDEGAYRWLEVDLDSDPPVITPGYAENLSDPQLDPPKRREPIQFPYQVSSSEPESFLITAMTEACDCEWTARITWQSEGRTGTVVIDDEGEPFRTVSPSRAVATCDLGGCPDQE